MTSPKDNPKVGEKEMLDYLQKNCPCPCQAYPDGKCKIAIEEQCYETHRAIRAAIEERGRLRDGIKKWFRRLLIVNADGCCDGETQMFLDELETYWHDILGDDFKLDGEEEK